MKGAVKAELATATASAVGKPLIAGTAEELVEQAAGIAARDGAVPAARSMDQLLPNGKVPGTRGGAFNKWFDDLTSEELKLLWQNKDVRTSIETRIRYPGQLHEGCMVCRAPEFKEWGFQSMKFSDLELKPLSWNGSILTLASRADW